MQEITEWDIRQLREYLKKLDALRQEHPPVTPLSDREWRQILRSVSESGTIPQQYAGRIGTRLMEDPETGEEREMMVDTLFESYITPYNALQEEYREVTDKVFINGFKSKKWGKKSTEELIREITSVPQLLDISNLPNMLITDPRLQYAITPKRNQYAYIMPFNYEQLEFQFDENGELIIGTKAQYEAVEHARNKKSIQAAGIDSPLLRQLLAATMKAHLSNYGSSITVSLPAFAREMNIDIRYSGNKAAGEDPKHNPNDFFKKLKALEGLNGVWQGGSFYRVFALESYDADQNTLTFTSPWLYKIVKELQAQPVAQKATANGAIKWKITGISSLMKASINSARSKPTVEIIAVLIAGLKQRGVTPDSKIHPKRKYKDPDSVSYSVSFSTIIERTPIVMENLEACKASNKTTLLQRYFCGYNLKERAKEGKGYLLEEYIENFTFLKQYYKDFKIKFKPPTVNTLNESIVITHRGINGDFEKNNPFSIVGSR